MRFLYLIGDEYHDDYQPHYTFEGTPEELKVEIDEAEYYMQGYAWWAELHGPVQVKPTGVSTTMADIWPT